MTRLTWGDIVKAPRTLFLSIRRNAKVPSGTRGHVIGVNKAHVLVSWRNGKIGAHSPVELLRVGPWPRFPR
jgi:hypothetical protein